MHISFLILLPTKKNLESMCVLCARNVHSKKAVVCCKVQTLDCALTFANPNFENLNPT
jgi:hypothetical protein